MDLIIIPSFIAETLSRKNIPIKSVVDFNKIKDVLSVNDIATFLGIQDSKYWKLLVPTSLKNEEYTNFNFYTLLSNSADTVNRKHFDSIYSHLVDTRQCDKEILERLFNANNKNSDSEKPYEMIDIADQLVGVIIYPGYFPEESIKNPNKILSDIIKKMYVYHPLDEIAKSCFYRPYIASLL